MIYTIIFLLLVIYFGSVYLTYQISGYRYYILGREKEAMISPFRPYVEANKTFCYDDGAIIEARKGKRSYIPLYNK